MTDQLLGWLAHADGAVTAAIPFVKHLRELATELGGIYLTGLGAWRVLRPAPRASVEPGRKLAKGNKRRVKRRPGSNNQP